MASSALVLDNLDDRREIHRLLSLVHPRRRVEWLAWCCRWCVARNPRAPVRPSTRRMVATVEQAGRGDRADLVLTNEVYRDAFHLAHQFGLDLDAAAKELVRMVRAKAPSGPGPART